MWSLQSPPKESTGEPRPVDTPPLWTPLPRGHFLPGPFVLLCEHTVTFPKPVALVITTEPVGFVLTKRVGDFLLRVYTPVSVQHC